MASTSEIAAAWGCSRQAIYKWIKKGMPTSSIEAASSWRMSHGERSARVRLVPDFTPPAPADDDASPAALADGDSAEAVRDRARKAERAAYAIFQKRMSEQNYDGIHAALKNFNVAQAGRAKAEMDFIKHQQAIGAVVDRSASISAQNRKLASVRDHLLSLPDACAKRCNPTDPDLAALVLQEWAESTLRIASEA